MGSGGFCGLQNRLRGINLSWVGSIPTRFRHFEDKGVSHCAFCKKHNAAPFLCIYGLLKCLSYLLGNSCYSADYSFHLLFSIEQTRAQAASSLLKRTHGLMGQWCAMQTASSHNPVFLF